MLLASKHIGYVLLCCATLLAACKEEPPLHQPPPQEGSFKGGISIERNEYTTAAKPLSLHLYYPDTLNRSITLSAAGGPVTYAVNNSPDPISLWSEVCIWGRFNLEYQFRTTEGKLYTLQRGLDEWYAMNPVPFKLMPGDTLAFRMNRKELWVSQPQLPDSAVLKGSLQAFYTSMPESLNERFNIWEGSLRSNTIDNLELKP